LCILVPFIVLALAAPYLPISGPLETKPTAGFISPSLEHPLGTDRLGRDGLSRLLAGARTSLFVGFVAASVAVTVGMLLGTVAGFLGRTADNLIMMLVDVFLAFPGLLLT